MRSAIDWPPEIACTLGIFRYLINAVPAYRLVAKFLLWYEIFMPAPNYRQIPIIVYLSDVTKQI